MNWYKTAQITINEIAEKWKNKGITLSLFEYNDKVIIDSIIIPKELRKQGIGTQIMDEIINYADQTGKRIELTPGKKDTYHGTTSRQRLVDFYKRFGLVENKGRHKDYTTMSGMYRDPKETQ